MQLTDRRIPQEQFTAYRQTNSPRTVCILAFPSSMNMLILHLASLLNVLILQCSLQKYTFQAVSFRKERTISLSRLEKVLKLISLCNLHPRTKESCWRLPDLRTANCCMFANLGTFLQVAEGPISRNSLITSR